MDQAEFEAMSKHAWMDDDSVIHRESEVRACKICKLPATDPRVPFLHTGLPLSIDERVSSSKRFSRFVEFIEGELKNLEGEELEDAVEQLEVFMEALGIYVNRQRQYGMMWKKQGWLAALMNLGNKAQRVMNRFWTQKKQPEEDLDDVLDLLNYSAMFVRGSRSLRERGELW